MTSSSPSGRLNVIYLAISCNILGEIRLTGTFPNATYCMASNHPTTLICSCASENSRLRMAVANSLCLAVHSSLEVTSWRVSCVDLAKVFRTDDTFASA
jgi:hypothetical protein